MRAVRRIAVDTKKCIGCQACTHICPANLIGFNDRDGERTLQFAITCEEDCARCADACSENAIILGTVDTAIDNFFTVQFPLQACSDCGAFYATEKMVNKLSVSLPSLLIPDDGPWLSTCLECRRSNEAKQVAVRGLMSRAF